MRTRGSRLTVAQRKKILKYGKAHGITEKNIGDYLYQGLKHVPVDSDGLGRDSMKREEYSLVNVVNNEIVKISCDVLR